MAAVTIERIPIEILVRIFKFYKDQYQGYGDTTQYLFRLSLVCRFWREAIRKCPTLWSDIWLDVSTGKVEQQAAYQLERAGGALLSLAILFPYEYDEGEGTEILPMRMADIFRDTMDRWKSFRMHAHPYETQLFLNSCAGGCTPNLSKITIRSRVADHEGAQPVILIPFSRAAGIESGPPVTTRFRSVLPIYSSLGANVTKLEVDAMGADLSADNFAAALSSCPNLVQLDVTSESDLIVGHTSTLDTVPLLHLTDLRLSYIRDPEHLLGVLRLEALQSLRIDAFDWSPAMQSALRSIFRTCGSLKTVAITGAGLRNHDEEPSSLLPPEWTIVLPSVTRFSLHADAVIYPLLRQLSLPQAQTFFLEDAPCDVALSLLASATQLASAKLLDIFDAVPQNAHIISLPNLSSLKMAESLELLPYIDAPNLSELSLTSHRSAPPLTAVRGLLERSAPPLRKLQLDIKGLTDGEIIGCLQRLPLLEHLLILNCVMSDATMRALEKPPPSEHGADSDSEVLLLPRLKSATLWSHYTTIQGFEALVTSRETVNWRRYL
ncbi:hypothetical protein BOTBODRAFT_186222 [Botryobasidium botryosum FD-172 SS1]|uniref:F-box domain-containing protein n=1 Tax=Botryobasidium botryosum (strain FD-172 SS1) TaxID=930990 RepID=A0A067MMQ6_BOTB1|nr:hypothetical protein BOTBODRAFT_186222 [Botryobasidium botryosum FD-172 SS1]